MTANPALAQQVAAAAIQRPPAQVQQPSGFAQQQQAGAGNIDLDQKKLQDIVDALTYIGNIREDINVILDNVGKSNPSSNYSSVLAARANLKQLSEVNNSDHQKAANNGQEINEQDQIINSEQFERFLNLDLKQQQFVEKSDTKYLQERIVNFNRNLTELDRVLKELTPIQFVNINDYNTILLDQTDERASMHGSNLVHNYRWWFKVQENITSTTLMPYKRFQQTYSEKKLPHYRSYSIKPIKKEEIEKLASTHLAHNEIKVVSSQKTENQFVLDIIMPQYFKFVLLLFDLSVEKLQVRQLDNRLLKIYSNNKPSDEICLVDNDHKNLSNVFQRLEENCVQACLYFRTEQGNGHFRYLLNWLKNYTNLFNAKCVKCEKHLLNGVPPTFRDFKTFEPYHDECRM